MLDSLWIWLIWLVVGGFIGYCIGYGYGQLRLMRQIREEQDHYQYEKKENPRGMWR